MRTLASHPAEIHLMARTRNRIRTTTLNGLLYAALLATAGVYVAAFIVTALLRLSYPFPLQITESEVLREVERILGGQPLYVAPTFNHVPLIYGPLYFYASALVALLTGPSYLPMRLVSTVASVCSLTLIARLVSTETRSRGAGLIAAGLLAATYPVADTALDQGRVDATFLFLLLAGICVAHSAVQSGSRGWLAVTVSGGLIGLAGLTKVPMGAAPVALAVGMYLAVTVRWRVLAFVVGCGAIVVGGLLLLRLQSGPWPTWYLLDLPAQHAVEQKFLGRLWFTDLLPRLTLPFLLGPVFVLGGVARGKLRPLLFYGLIVPCLIGLAWASRSNNGGATNVLLPALAALAILLGLGVHETLRQLGTGDSAATRERTGEIISSDNADAGENRDVGGQGYLGARGARVGVFRWYVLAVCLVQFALLAYNPRLLVPYRSDQWADERLAARLASLPGKIFAPDLDGYLHGSDKGEQPLLAAMGELNAGYGGTRTGEGVAWTAELRQALRERAFSFVVLSETECCLTGDVLGNGYVDEGPLFPPDDEFWLWKTTHTPEVHLYAAPTS